MLLPRIKIPQWSRHSFTHTTSITRRNTTLQWGMLYRQVSCYMISFWPILI